jgi:hypothetical protein
MCQRRSRTLSWNRNENHLLSEKMAKFSNTPDNLHPATAAREFRGARAREFRDSQGGPNPLCARLVPCRFRLALQRKSGPRIALPAVLPSRYVTSVGHTGLLRRPWMAISGVCHDHTACSNERATRATAARPQRPPPFLHVPPRALWLECAPVEEKKAPHPDRERDALLSACRRREKGPSGL